MVVVVCCVSMMCVVWVLLCLLDGVGGRFADLVVCGGIILCV